ncbi:hypothetical protein JCM19046_439 [Bacillus sp. JCM 19046]|nr:hypothetical protein JCM19045_2645 [Bacillus sp. JCM 19045]GAF16034.1 hypothetical protein JCM19046_439 [Bacillus sp. JCM 19046]
MQKKKLNWKSQLHPLKFFSRFFHSPKRASLVVVTNHWELCKQENERLLCRYLRERGLYASPDYVIDHVSIDVALVPYRIALMRKQEPANERKIARFLQRKGWTVYFYSDNHIRQEMDQLFYAIEMNIHPFKNASLTN